jgi:hypothetical protein
MNDRLQAIVASLTDEQRTRIELEDRLRAGLVVQMAGVDITDLPRLPPELEKARRPAEPPGKPPDQHRRRRRG